MSLRWQTERCICGTLMYPQAHSCARCYDEGGIGCMECFSCGTVVGDKTCPAFVPPSYIMDWHL